MNLLETLETKFGVTLQHGRNVLAGCPVDMDARQDPTMGLVMTPVDSDAARDLLEEFRRAGLSAVFFKKSGEVLVNLKDSVR